MASLSDILNLDLGLGVRNRLNAIIKFYNAVVKSDSLFNVERIDASYVKDATPTTTKFLRDDGTWQTVATNQDLEQTLANGESTGTGYTIYFNLPPVLLNELQAKVMTVNHFQQLVASSINISDVQLKSNKGIANGYASLDAGGLIPSSQLPSYVDDVLEYSTLSAFPSTGEAGKIYLAIDTTKQYRWGGSSYLQISDGKATWGGIDGLLSNQSDIQIALNAKQNSLGFTPENAAEKQNSLAPDGTGMKYVTVDAVNTMDFATVPIGWIPATSFASNTTYYTGLLLNVAPTSSTSSSRKFVAPITGKAYALSLVTQVGVASVGGTHSIVLANITTGQTTTITSAHYYGIQTYFYNSFTNLAVTVGDTLEVRLVNGVFTTAPTSIMLTGLLYFKK